MSGTISGLGSSTKMMGAALALTMGWVLFSGCGCDKQDKFSGVWVGCIGERPTLLRYDGDNVVEVTHQDPRFDPNKWDCHKDASSPEDPNKSQSVFTPYGPGGPEAAAARQRARAANSRFPSVLLPRGYLALPLTPRVPPPASPPVCDSSYSDVLQVNHNGGFVVRYSTCPFQIKTAIPVAALPLQIAITPNGSTAVVTSFANAISFIDLATNTVTSTMNTDASINPDGIAISSDGSRAYITNFSPDSPAVLVMDLATHQFISSIPVTSYPKAAFLTPDGSQLWVTFPLGQSVYVIDTLSNTIATLLPISQATGVAFNSTGTRAYVTSATGPPGVVVAVDTSTFQVANTYTVGVGPTDIAMSYADEFLVVNNYDGNSVSVVDLVKNTVVTLQLDDTPIGIAFVR